MKVDAIVNTANPMPCYGAGLDKAVYEAAGEKELLKKRREIGEISPGHSVLTEGFGLPARYIIHTVGTTWKGGCDSEEDIIRKCYRSIFELVSKNNIGSLAIPLLASGCYGFPKGIALRIALSETEAYLAEHDTDIYLVVFDEKSFSLSSELYGDIDEYINDNYVEEKTREEYEYGHAPELNEAGREDGRAFAANRTGWEGGGASAANRAGRSVFSGLFGIPEAPDHIKHAGADNMSHVPSYRKKTAAPVWEESTECAAQIQEPVGLQPAAKAKSLDDVIKNLDKTFMELVFSFADAKGLTDVEVQKKANLDRKAFSKLKCGTTKNPSKATALALAVALELDLDDTKDLLSRAGFALSPCSRQDLIVQYFIERKVYDIYAINIALFEHGEQLLGCASGS